jgi:hypothetical protein
MLGLPMGGNYSTPGDDRWRQRQVERRLVAEMNEARQLLHKADLDFRNIVGAIPSGVPAPDSSLHITKAGQECGRLREALTEAEKRWFDFVIHGTVPDGLPE